MSTYTVNLVQTRIGQPKVIAKDRHGQEVWSSIDREIVEAPEVYLTWTGLAGDQPTETRPKTSEEGGYGQIHGGNDKAVYVYPLAHYGQWAAELSDAVMSSHSLGENWQVLGVAEEDVRIGDIWELGEAILEVSKARQPCQTLVTYYEGRPMIKLMAANGFCGWYMRVLRPGPVPTKARIRATAGDGPSVAEEFARKMRR